MHKRHIYKSLYNAHSKNGLKCYLCGKSLEEEWRMYLHWLKNRKKRCTSIRRSDVNLNIDHITPLSVLKKNDKALGLDTHLHKYEGNMRLVHKTCNTLKGNKLVDKTLLQPTQDYANIRA